MVVKALVRARDMATLLSIRTPKPSDAAASGFGASGLSVTHAFAARPAVVDIDLDAPAGRQLWVTGGNGSGKTTLLLALAGVVGEVVEARVAGSVTRPARTGCCSPTTTVLDRRRRAVLRRPGRRPGPSSIASG